MSAQVQPFISTVPGTLDNKGRVCIPASFRQILAAQSTQGVYLCPSFSEAALECFGEEVLQAFNGQIAEINPFFAKDLQARFDHYFSMSAKVGWISGYATAFWTMATSFSGKSGMAMMGLSFAGILSGSSWASRNALRKVSISISAKTASRDGFPLRSISM